MSTLTVVVTTVLIYSAILSVAFLYQDIMTDADMSWMTAVFCGPVLWVLALLVIIYGVAVNLKNEITIRFRRRR